MVLAALTLAVSAAWVGGFIAVRLHQARVIGELVAGLLLGPTLFGAVAPEAFSVVFPADVVGSLAVVAELGLVFFVFLVGLEFDPDELRGQGSRTAAVSVASIIVPFTLGVLVAPWVHGQVGERSDLRSYAVFIGLAMAITAFPVLVRILDSLGLTHTRIGALVVACAGIGDVVAWILLAVAVAMATAGSALDVVRTVVLTAVFAVVVLTVVRPVLARFERPGLPVIVAGTLLAAWITERIGVSVILGAFLFGLVVPRGSIAGSVDRALRPVTTTVLLPVFFVTVGLATQVGSLDTVQLWLVAVAVVGVAAIGKILAGAGAARATGESLGSALAVGSLLNARGLTEIVILTIGLEVAVIGPTTFTIMVLMAIVTTIAAGPLARRFLGLGPPGSSGDRSGLVTPSADR
jgi:Kef-type K+ transport system membrane component KefB